MTTTTLKPAKVAKKRGVCWVEREGPARGIICIRIDGKATRYRLSSFESDWGFGYTLHNLANGKVYDLNTDAKHPHCDCPSHAKDGECKHVLAMRAMREAGQVN